MVEKRHDLGRKTYEREGNRMKESLWKQTYENILIGIGFVGITLNFLFLNQILPFIGVLLVFTGFRKLRRENQWFRIGYAGAGLKVVITIVSIVLGAVLGHEEIYASYVWKVIAFCGGILPIVLMGCFYFGMRAELEKRDVNINHEVLLHLLIWYVVVAALAAWNYQGLILALIILAAYIGILVELKHIAEKLEEAGYILEEQTVRISNEKCVGCAVVLTVAGLFSAYLFLDSYHMEWTMVKESQDPVSEEIKDHLLSLGLPEDILDDLTEEDLLDCKNARQVLVERDDYPMNDGVDIISGTEGYTQYSKEYPQKELKLSGAAVELEQEGQWKVIHHFLWNGNPGFRGTEAVQINPAYQELNGGWTSQGKLTGQVLYDKDGTSYTADYKILQDENYDTGMNAFFYGSQQNASIFAEFSLPRSGENCRGYVAYEIKAKESDWWIDSWLNYTHQNTLVQYPVLSAAQSRKQGGVMDGRMFTTVQNALQVLPGERE